MLERITQTISELPAWFISTPTGRKALLEREEAEKKLKALSFEERKTLAAEYLAALETEGADTEIAALRAEDAELRAQVEAARKVVADAPIRLHHINKTITRRIATHREAVMAKRELLRSSAPPEIDAFITELAQLAAENTEINDQLFDPAYLEGAVPMDSTLISYKTLRPSKLARQVSIHTAMAAARRLKVEALTVPQLEARFAQIRKQITDLKPTTFRRKQLGGEFVPQGN